MFATLEVFVGDNENEERLVYQRFLRAAAFRATTLQTKISLLSHGSWP